MNLGLNNVASILCLGAHPDDIEIGCGGTVAKLARANPDADVSWVVLSGCAQRAGETHVAAARLLPTSTSRHVIVESFRDSFFPYEGSRIKEFFHELARDKRPDIVFTHRREDLHQDHRLVTELTWNAFRQQLILEYEIPKYDGDLGTPNFYVPLTKDEASDKIDVITKSFQSQHDKNWFSSDTFWAMLRIRGIECHAESGLAEGLFCRKLQVDL